MMALAIPLVAVGLQHSRSVVSGPWQSLFHRWQSVTLAIALMTTVTCTLANHNKKLYKLLIHDQARLRCVTRPEMLPVLEWLRQRVTVPASIGFFGGEDDWDYLCFLPSFKNTVLRFPLSDAALVDQLRLGRLEYAIVHLPESQVLRNPRYTVEKISEQWTGIAVHRVLNRDVSSRVPDSGQRF
jgi:hypothetical protein